MPSNELIDQGLAFIREEQRTARVLPEEEFATFTMASIAMLTSEYLEPAVHETAKNIPPTPSEWLGVSLHNAADDILSHDDIAGLLPARTSSVNGTYRFDGLYLPMDGGPLKLVTDSTTSDVSGDSMHVALYHRARPTEAERYRARRAELGEHLDPNVALFMPTETVSYTSNPTALPTFSCTYWNGHNSPDNIRHYSNSETAPHNLPKLHRAFMRIAAIAFEAMR